MDLTKRYYGQDGSEHNIAWMVKNEPDWAASRIQVGEDWHEVIKECERILETPDTAEAPRMSNLPNLVRDLQARKTPKTAEDSQKSVQHLKAKIAAMQKVLDSDEAKGKYKISIVVVNNWLRQLSAVE